MSALTAPTPSLHTTPPPTTHSAVRLRGVPNKGIFVLTHTNTTSPITWNGTTATLGWVTLATQSWTVRAHLDAARYDRYPQGLAATPALINGPDLHAISYPVKEREDATRRLLLHAPLALADHHAGKGIDWKARTNNDGRVINEATLVAIEDHIGLVPVVALHGPHLVDLAQGDVGDMVIRVGEGFERRFILPVNSMDVTRQELFQRLADLGSFD